MGKGAASLGISPPFFSVMRNAILLFLMGICAVALALPQSDTKPKAASPATKSSAKKASAKKAATKKGTSSKNLTKTTAGKKSTKAAAASWHPRQMTPTPERYKEIQQALVDKGYLKSEPNGVWDAQSIDALRQFQTDHKLSVTGRISSASLIGLGLGPNTATTETPSAPAATSSSPVVPAPEPPPTPEN
jgi:peptidoglycan hydrolase-like protein with peptidoglycan-binding domain